LNDRTGDELMEFPAGIERKELLLGSGGETQTAEGKKKKAENYAR